MHFVIRYVKFVVTSQQRVIPDVITEVKLPTNENEFRININFVKTESTSNSATIGK